MSWTGYLKTSLWGDLSNASVSVVAGRNEIGIDHNDTWMDIGFGVAAQANQNVSVYADADFEFDISGNDHRGFSGKIGARFDW